LVGLGPKMIKRTVWILLRCSRGLRCYSTARLLCVLLGRPERQFRTGLCFTRDVSFFHHAFSVIPRPIAPKLCHAIGIWLYFINWLQKFGRGVLLQKNLGAINMRNVGQFWTTSDLIADISGTRQHIQNRKDVRTREIPPAFDEKSPVNFGPQTAWNYMWVWTQ